MSESRVFALGAVLTVTTDRLFCEMGMVYEILNYLTRDNLFTHQLPRAMRECAPHLLRQHPALAAVDVSDVAPDNVRERLAALENDGEAVDLFVNFVDAADKLLAWHERKHPEETPT